MACFCTPSTKELGAGRPEVQGHPLLHSEFGAAWSSRVLECFLHCRCHQVTAAYEVSPQFPPTLRKSLSSFGRSQPPRHALFQPGLFPSIFRSLSTICLGDSYLFVCFLLNKANSHSVTQTAILLLQYAEC